MIVNEFQVSWPNPIEKAVEGKLLRCLSKGSVEAKNFSAWQILYFPTLIPASPFATFILCVPNTMCAYIRAFIESAKKAEKRNGISLYDCRLRNEMLWNASIEMITKVYGISFLFLIHSRCAFQWLFSKKHPNLAESTRSTLVITLRPNSYPNIRTFNMHYILSNKKNSWYNHLIHHTFTIHSPYIHLTLTLHSPCILIWAFYSYISLTFALYSKYSYSRLLFS